MLNVSFWSWIGANIFLIGWEIYWLGIRHVNHEPMLQRPFYHWHICVSSYRIIGLIFSGLSVDGRSSPSFNRVIDVRNHIPWNFHDNRFLPLNFLAI